MMNTWSLNKKIVLTLSVFVIALALMASYGFIQLRNISGDFNEVTDVKLKQVTLLREMREASIRIGMSEKDMILANDAADIQKYVKILDDEAAFYLKMLDEAEALAEIAQKSNYEELKATFATLFKTEQNLKELAIANKDKEGHELSFGKLHLLRQTLGKIETGLLEEQVKAMNDLADESETTAKRAGLMFMIIGLGSLLFGSTLAYLILTSASVAIQAAIKKLGQNSEEVAAAAAQIASASTELSQSTVQQSAALQETTTSVEELSAMTRKNADCAVRTAELSSNSGELAENGRSVVNEMVTAIQEINQNNSAIMEQIEKSNQRFSEITQIITEIGGKTKIINDIVFQTKLLSFNASVEAARAGDHGKGFSVVAEEVGNLAQMSGTAAKEISIMLDTSIEKVSSIVHETQSMVERLVSAGKEKVETGARVAKQCETALSEILECTTQVKTMASSIASSSQEQSQGIQEIAKAMNQLDAATQQNASVSQQASASSESLSQQAQHLRKVMGEMKVAILGGTAGENKNISLSHPKESQPLGGISFRST